MDDETALEATDDLYAEQPRQRKATVWTSPVAKVLLCILLGLFGIFMAILLVRAGPPKKISGWLAIVLYAGVFLDGIRVTLMNRWGQRGAFMRWAFVLLLLFFAVVGAVAVVTE